MKQNLLSQTPQMTYAGCKAALFQILKTAQSFFLHYVTYAINAHHKEGNAYGKAETGRPPKLPYIIFCLMPNTICSLATIRP